MNLRFYVENLHRQLAAAAAVGGDDARAIVEQLAAPLDAAIRLTLQDALAAAAEEITTELAPGSVELRLRGRDPEFVVTLPPSPPPRRPATSRRRRPCASRRRRAKATRAPHRGSTSASPTS